MLLDEADPVIARFVALFFVFGLVSADAGSVRVMETVLTATPLTFIDDQGVSAECGALQSGPSLDDPNVDTDPDRPLMDQTSTDGANADEQSDDDPNGMCRSESLEMWDSEDPDAFLSVMLESGRALG